MNNDDVAHPTYCYASGKKTQRRRRCVSRFTGDEIASDTDVLAPSLTGTADCALA